ncbi:hypothetical protein WA026_015159 [Henosepilachna vigintioctopunctata]|uniref:Uncharacterized protein n=1 Tax=Henosepilachna vigintioctopunctata TaxID=420089 RepID=A0AAW1TUV4_9CUCU
METCVAGNVFLQAKELLIIVGHRGIEFHWKSRICDGLVSRCVSYQIDDKNVYRLIPDRYLISSALAKVFIRKYDNCSEIRCSNVRKLSVLWP